jgi:glycosyltransferase involved in cell wall biosynthesis
MKILVAHDVPRSRTGGMSRIMSFVHDEVEQAGHTVEYFCTEDAPRSVGQPGWSRFSFPLAVYRKTIERAQAGRPYDIINIHEPSAAMAVLLRARLGGTKVVVTTHGIEQRGWNGRLKPEARPEERPSLRTRLLYPATLLWQANLALRRADHIICLNEEDRQYLITKIGRNSEEITRLFPGADPVFGQAAGSRDYSRCERLIFAGTWLERKGTQDLIASFSILARCHPTLQLLLLNPGAPESVTLPRFPEDVRPRVKHITASPEQGTAAVFADADVFILPSLFEGTPLTMIEGMWSGLPVVTTATCGMKDVIQHERNGLLVPLRDATSLTAQIQRLINNRSLRESLGRSAHRDAVSRFRWAEVAKPVLACYERLQDERVERSASSDLRTATTNGGAQIPDSPERLVSRRQR